MQNYEKRKKREKVANHIFKKNYYNFKTSPHLCSLIPFLDLYCKFRYIIFSNHFNCGLYPFYTNALYVEIV